MTGGHFRWKQLKAATPQPEGGTIGKNDTHNPERAERDIDTTKEVPIV